MSAQPDRSAWHRIAESCLAATIMFAPSFNHPEALAATLRQEGLEAPKASKVAGLKGKNGVLAAPSDSGLGLFVDKDARSLLHLAIPDVDKDAKEIQNSLELIMLRLEQVGFSGRTPIWNACGADATRASDLLKKHTDDFVKQVPPEKQEQARSLLNQGVADKLGPLREAIKMQEYPETQRLRLEAADAMATVRGLMAINAPDKTMVEIPDEYDGLPRLRGTATVEMVVKHKNEQSKLTLVLDGYHAPIVAGNFVDLVAKGALDKTQIAYGEELIVQVNKMAAPEKKIPLELFYRGDNAPSYGNTQDEDGRGTDTQVLPFQAFGALGMAHPDEDNDGGTSQFFWVKYSQALMPPGRNTLDGAYTCFGYTVDGTDILESLTKGDVIEKAVVVSGLENLKKL